MTELFLNILNMSISASWIVLAVLVLRLPLKKAPKWITVLLWGIVGVRLACPFSFESVLSLIPSSQTIPTNIAVSQAPSIESGVTIINETVNPIIADKLAPTPQYSVNPLQILVFVISVVWIAGLIAMLIYTAVSYIRLQKRINTAVLLKENIYQSEAIDSPFLLGILRPKIYLMYNIGEKESEYVISHEKAHLSRKDHLWKPLGFLFLTVYWFNPLIWVGYVMFCRDIELACDEKVISKLDTVQRADYSQALLNCSVNRRSVSACPVAFGEVSVKKRIKSVLNYKKPAFWAAMLAVVAVVATSVCLLTDPVSAEEAENPYDGSLLQTLAGSDDLSGITGFEIIHKYGGVTTEITDNNDLAFLKEYTYSHRYPNDQLHKLFIFPETQMIKVIIGGVNNYTMYLMQDGSIAIQAMSGDSGVTEFSYDVFTADSKYMLDEAALIELLKKYGGYTISQDP